MIGLHYFLLRLDFLFTVDLLLLAGCFRFLLLICLGGGSVAVDSSSVGIDSRGLS